MIIYIIGVIIGLIIGVFTGMAIEESCREDYTEELKNYNISKDMLKPFDCKLDIPESLHKMQERDEQINDIKHDLSICKDVIKLLACKDSFANYPDFEGDKYILIDKAKSFERVREGDFRFSIGGDDIITLYTSPENYKKYKSLIKGWEKEVKEYKTEK